LVGQHVSADGADIILLETVPENYVVGGRKLLEQIESSLPGHLRRSLVTAGIRFADNLPAPSSVHLEGHGQAALISAEWSTVFCESYVRNVMKKAIEEGRFISEEDIRQALVVLLASLLLPALQLPAVSIGRLPIEPLDITHYLALRGL
jgi:hypothetical protein